MKNTYTLQKEIYNRRLFDMEIPVWFFVLYGVGDNLTMAEISKNFGITYGTVIKILNAFEIKKIVKWKEYKNRKIYNLTSEGKNLYNLIVPLIKYYFVVKDNKFREELIK